MSIPEEVLLVDLIESHLLDGMVREFHFSKERGWRSDFAWPGEKLLVEVEGGTFGKSRHTSGTGYRADCEKYNAATLAGFRVLRFTTDMVASKEAIRDIQKALGRELC